MHAFLTLKPVLLINGDIDLPGSKSISNRVLLLAALAKGKTRLLNLLDSDDVKYMVHALRMLGIDCVLSLDRKTCNIIGNAGSFHISQKLELFLGNSGTAMRFLTALLCLEKCDIILTGEQRMKSRPIGDLVSALRQGGAKIDYMEDINFPPLCLHGGFKGGNINLNASISSQFLTALLISAPMVQKDTQINILGDLVSRPYIDITLRLMRSFGVDVENENYRHFYIRGQQQYKSPGDFVIEGDASSASYFLAAAAIKGGTVRVFGIDYKSIQGDILFLDILKKMGAVIDFGENYISCSSGSSLQGIDMDMNDVPDVAMTIAVMALFASGPTLLRNIYNWRLKECDRLKAMAIELRKVGAEVREGEDFIYIIPPSKFRHAKISTYNDHRMAMSFSLLALSNTSVTILDPACTSKTFPFYFDKFNKISHFF